MRFAQGWETEETSEKWRNVTAAQRQRDYFVSNIWIPLVMRGMWARQGDNCGSQDRM